MPSLALFQMCHLFGAPNKNSSDSEEPRPFGNDAPVLFEDLSKSDPQVACQGVPMGPEAGVLKQRSCTRVPAGPCYKSYTRNRVQRYWARAFEKQTSHKRSDSMPIQGIDR